MWLETIGGILFIYLFIYLYLFEKNKQLYYMSWDRREEDLFTFLGLDFPELELPAPYPSSTWPSARSHWPGLEARHAASLLCWNCSSRRRLIFSFIILFLNYLCFCLSLFLLRSQLGPHSFLQPGAMPSGAPTTVCRLCCQWARCSSLLGSWWGPACGWVCCRQHQ